MSHLTYVKTMFQDLFYLKKTFDKQNIFCHLKQITDSNLKKVQTDLIIPQSNKTDIVFKLNGNKYDLISDQDLWLYSYSADEFSQKFSKLYAEEVVIGEGQKIGFQPVKHKKNFDGSSTIILERYNSKV